MLKKFWNWLVLDEGCKNCELLRDLLQDERVAKEQLLVSLININKPVSVISNQNQEMPEPILPKVKPWRVQRAMLETADREKLKITDNPVLKSDRPIEDIERALGIGVE